MMYPRADRSKAIIKKVSIILFDVLIIASLIFLAFLTARAQDTSSLIITVTTDKSSYSYKEPIDITLEAENLTGEDVSISFSTGCQMGFSVNQYVTGSVGYSMPIYNDILYPRSCSSTPTSITVPNGNKAIWTRTFEFENTEHPPLLPGDYVLHGFIEDHEDELWSNQRTSYATFSVSFTEKGAEGSLCNQENQCASTLGCYYEGIFNESGGICLKNEYPYDDDNWQEQLCEGSGGDYNVDCFCPADFAWSDIVGCSSSVGLAEMCLSTEGYSINPAFSGCACEAGKTWNVTQGCTEGVLEGFNDIEGHWGEEYIMNLYNRGVVTGYDDGGFHPNDNINRAELTKMALSAASISTEDPAGDASFLFDDLDDWQIGWVYAAWSRGIVQGYDETTFAPGKDITRAEALKIAMEAFGVEVPDTSDEWAFPDTINHWAISYINQAYLDFIISGREDGNFYPNDPITRAEAAKIIQLLSQL